MIVPFHNHEQSRPVCHHARRWQALTTGLALLTALGLYPREGLAGGIPVTQATDEQREQAQVLFKAAVKKSAAKNFEGALADLRASFDLVASPNTKLRISRDLGELGRWADAYREAQMAQELAETAVRIDKKYEAAEKAARVDTETLRKKVGFVIVDLGPLRGELVVSGRTVPSADSTKPIAVDPGEVEILLRNPSGVRSVTVAVAAGEMQSAHLRDETTSALPKREKPPLTPFDMGEGQQITGIAFAAAGGLGMVLFTALGLGNVGLHNSVDKQCPNQRCPESLRSDVEQGQSLQLGANVSLVIGAVGLSAGAAFLIPTFFASKRRDNSADNAPKVRALLGPNFIGTEVKFQ
jgi:hypothetical protein